MIGLDTNVVLRYLLQDDPVQTSKVNDLVDRLSPAEPAYINITTVLEIVWVLRSLFKLAPSEVATHIEHLLAVDTFQIQNEQADFEAAFALKHGLGEF